MGPTKYITHVITSTKLDNAIIMSKWLGKNEIKHHRYSVTLPYNPVDKGFGDKWFFETHEDALMFSLAFSEYVVK